MTAQTTVLKCMCVRMLFSKVNWSLFERRFHFRLSFEVLEPHCCTDVSSFVFNPSAVHNLNPLPKKVTLIFFPKPSLTNAPQLCCSLQSAKSRLLSARDSIQSEAFGGKTNCELHLEGSGTPRGSTSTQVTAARHETQAW